MDRDLVGRTILLTGATEGIGKAAARALARRGATLVLVGRSAEKTTRVAEQLRAESGAPISTIVADLSTLAGMRAAAAGFRASHPRLDVLVNNAGAEFEEHALTEDGLERTFALNHLSYFVVTTRLLDLLQATPGARVVCTASGAHRWGRLDLTTVATRPSGRAGMAAYGDSKLANILFVRELSRRLTGSGVAANAFHPGWVNTGFALNNEGVFAWGVKTFAPALARTPEQGADTLIWLATAPEAAGVTGEYFYDREVARTWPRARDADLARGLWALSAKLCGGEGPLPGGAAGGTGA